MARSGDSAVPHVEVAVEVSSEGLWGGSKEPVELDLSRGVVSSDDPVEPVTLRIRSD